MASVDFDAVELDYKTPVEKIYSHFSSRTTLFGTVDPSGILTFGSLKDVEEETTKILSAYEGNARLVVGAGCAIPPMAPEENIRALIRTAHTHEIS
jgi:uroporphyrinogen-III decarboxylase